MPKDVVESSALAAMDYKSLSFKLLGVPDDDGKFEGYASVFDVVDLGMDVVAPGAFRRSLDSGRNVKLLWQHDMASPIGVWEEIKEDEKGLFVRGRLLTDVQQGREANALMRAGAIDSMSIGFKTIEAVAEGNGSVRRLTEVELFEISLVTFPMLPDAQITAVKSIRTIRDFEKALRDAGFSKTEAKAIAAKGFKGLADHRDDVEVAVSPDLDAYKAISEQLQTLRGKLTNV
jgi:HK97 family phage prohead protease